jgi:hypothetical protein
MHAGSLQLRRWRVAVAVTPGWLNCRAGPSTTETKVLKLAPKAVVEAVGPPTRVDNGGSALGEEWLQIKLHNITGGPGLLGAAAVTVQDGMPSVLSSQNLLPETAWVILRDQVRRPLRPFWRAVSTELYLCNVCFCQEILRRNGRGQNHARPELRGVSLLDPIDGDAPWLRVANPCHLRADRAPIGNSLH